MAKRDGPAAAQNCESNRVFSPTRNNCYRRDIAAKHGAGSRIRNGVDPVGIASSAGMLAQMSHRIAILRGRISVRALSLPTASERRRIPSASPVSLARAAAYHRIVAAVLIQFGMLDVLILTPAAPPPALVRSLPAGIVCIGLGSVVAAFGWILAVLARRGRM